MSKSKRKLYNSDKINNFRELVDRYQKLYSDKVAFEYKETPHSKEHIKITYGDFVSDIKALRNLPFEFRITWQKNSYYCS